MPINPASKPATVPESAPRTSKPTELITMIPASDAGKTTKRFDGRHSCRKKFGLK
jgi:hypothetical protein